MPTPEVMFSHRRFLRAIARSLVRDEQGAEDIVQETLVRAWQSAPPQSGNQSGNQSGSLRGWLGKIARNLSIDHLRGARRHERLQQQVEAAGAAPSAEDVLLHEEQRQRLVRAVLALPQPYRDVVLLRFWEELTPAQIAARLALPGATVRSQLLRGLALLRERLDQEYGDRRAWLTALAPFAAGSATTAAASTAIATFLIMNSKLAASFAALLLVGLLAWWWWPTDPTLTPAATPAAATQVAASAVREAATDQPAAAPSPDTAESTRSAPAPTGDLLVRGQVLQKGQPRARTELRLEWFDGFDADGECTSEMPLVCDADGRFEWRGALRQEVGTVRVLGAEPRLKLWNTPALVLPDAREVVLEVSVVPLDRELTGRVHDTAGAPIAGALLSVNGWTESEVTTDGGGHYAMHVPADTYPLLVTATGFKDLLVRGYMPKDLLRNDHDIEMLPGATITGRVLGPDGAPIADAKVRASGAFRPTQSGADGRFVIDGVSLGQRHMVQATCAGFQTGSVTARVGGDPVEIVLQPGLSFDVRVLDQDGKPVVGAAIKAILELHSGAAAMGLTRLDGRLRLADLGTKPFTLLVEHPGFVGARSEVDAAKVEGELTVSLQKGFDVSGQVVDDTGQPVIGSSVYCEIAGAVNLMDRRAVGTRAMSGAEGRFVIHGLPPERCVIYAFHKDYNRASFEFRGGTTHEVLLRLQPAPAVAGRVVDGTTGAPLNDFIITVSAAREDQSLHTDPVSFHGSDGYFVFRYWQMQVGAELVVEAKAKGYAASTVRSVALASPPRGQTLISMFVGTRVEGIVRDAREGTPLAGVAVSLSRWDRRSQPGETCVSDAEGHFALDNLAPGEHRLRLQREGYPEAITEPFTAATDVPLVTITATMSHGITLRGRVPDATGAGSLTVRANCEVSDVQGKVREDGTFELQGLAPGRTLVSVADAQRRTRYRQIEVGDADIVDFELPLETGTGSVRLQIKGATSGNVRAELLDDASEEDRTPVLWMPFVGEQVLLRGLAPGRYRLSVDTRIYGEDGRAEVEVGAGETTASVEVRKQR